MSLTMKEQREVLRRRGVANWATLSDARIRQFFPGMKFPSMSGTPRPEDHLTTPERRLWDAMEKRDRPIYLAIREAAVKGEVAPSLARLSEHWPNQRESSVRRAVDRLVALGAVKRAQVGLGSRPTVYEIPLLGKTTYCEPSQRELARRRKEARAAE